MQAVNLLCVLSVPSLSLFVSYFLLLSASSLKMTSAKKRWKKEENGEGRKQRWRNQETSMLAATSLP